MSENREFNILAVVTARGGSQSIPKKNIKELGGEPLISYTFRSAQKSRRITDLILSTDDRQIAEMGKRYGVVVPFMRPADLAKDTTPHVPVMKHASLEMEKLTGKRYDYLVILQPTSPFRTSEDIDETLRKLTDSGADSAVTLVDVGDLHPVKAKRLQGDQVLPFSVPEEEGVRRQDLPPAYRRSGSVYAMRRNLIVEDNRLYGDHIVGHVVPPERSIDINDEIDWMRAELMLRNLRDKGFEF